MHTDRADQEGGHCIFIHSDNWVKMLKNGSEDGDKPEIKMSYELLPRETDTC